MNKKYIYIYLEKSSDTGHTIVYFVCAFDEEIVKEDMSVVAQNYLYLYWYIYSSIAAAAAAAIIINGRSVIVGYLLRFSLIIDLQQKLRRIFL